MKVSYSALLASRKGFPVSAVHIFNQSLKGHVVNTGAALPRIMDRHLFPLCPVNQDIVDLFRIILKGSIQAKMVLFGQGVQDRPGKAPSLAQDCQPRTAMAPSLMLKDLSGIIRSSSNSIFVSQSKALRTGPKGIIEGKAPGLHLPRC